MDDRKDVDDEVVVDEYLHPLDNVPMLKIIFQAQSIDRYT